MFNDVSSRHADTARFFCFANISRISFGRQSFAQFYSRYRVSRTHSSRRRSTEWRLPPRLSWPRAVERSSIAVVASTRVTSTDTIRDRPFVVHGVRRARQFLKYRNFFCERADVTRFQHNTLLSPVPSYLFRRINIGLSDDFSSFSLAYKIVFFKYLSSKI